MILKQIEPWTAKRVGHGRVFIAIYAEQVEWFRRHVEQEHIETTV